jgi:hypothetical protein
LTAALAHLAGPTVRSCSRRHSARILSVLALVLPVPVFAALGLSLPLPDTVERIAARLVPFLDSDALSSENAALVGKSGTIILASGERTADESGVGSKQSPAAPFSTHSGTKRGVGDNPTVVAPSGSGPRIGSPTDTAVAPTADARSSSAPVDAGGITGPTPSEGSTTTPAPTPSGGGDDPDAGTPQVVDTAIGTVNTAVGTVTTPVADTTKGVTDSAASTVNGAVGAVLPPKP